MAENICVSEVVMWKRPLLAVLLLACGTLVWYNIGPLKRSLTSLVSDVLLTFVCSLGLLGVICRHLKFSIPVDPLEWQVSSDLANDIAACFANTVGAAEGVLRVAASGSDSKLFCKVVLVLYLISAVGRSASGATIAYMVLWFMFIVPYGVAKFIPEATSNTPTTFLQKKLPFIGNSTPGTSPRSTFNSPQRMSMFT